MPNTKLNKILVPVSGSAADATTVGMACRIAKISKGKVFVIYVIEVKRTLPLDAEIDAELQKGERVLEEAERSAQEVGYSIETELLQLREIGPAVVDDAVEHAVDLVVMGVAYNKPFGEFDLGRSAAYLLRHAPCRVWLMREAVNV